jgi:hypothetical protein
VSGRLRATGRFHHLAHLRQTDPAKATLARSDGLCEDDGDRTIQDSIVDRSSIWRERSDSYNTVRLTLNSRKQYYDPSAWWIESPSIYEYGTVLYRAGGKGSKSLQNPFLLSYCPKHQPPTYLVIAPRHGSHIPIKTFPAALVLILARRYLVVGRINSWIRKPFTPPPPSPSRSLPSHSANPSALDDFLTHMDIAESPPSPSSVALVLVRAVDDE